MHHTMSFRIGRWFSFFALCALSFCTRGETVQTSQPFFDKSIRPTLREYCLKCHSTEKHKGDLDLERFTAIEEVKRQPKVWQQVIEQLGQNEMPPKDQPQLAAAKKDDLLNWINALLDEVALAQAGDPGPVVLRRLSNAEYTYTIRDLTGVESLNPAREFPVDSAAGEGFMNVGNSLVMSPALLTKYLDAGKEIASHAVLLPDGLRFSPSTTRRDWTEEIMAEIRALYSNYTEKGGGTAVNLQGIKFDTKDGGVIPVRRYFEALLQERSTGNKADAAKLGLSPKYLDTLRHALNDTKPSLLLDPLRAKWRSAKLSDAAELASDVETWQRPLWKFNSVGHIGKAGGPKMWLEPFSPLMAEQEIRLKIPVAPDAKEVTLYLSAGDAGDGSENDFVVWKEPRFIAPGRAPVLLRDARETIQQLGIAREKILAAARHSLDAAAEMLAADKQPELADLARKHDVDKESLEAWLGYLGIAADGPVTIGSYFTNTLAKSSGYDFINGWGGPATPNLSANSSDQPVRIPGNMKPHSIAVHPSPKLQAVVGWKSPVTSVVRVDTTIQHAHPECGNGVTWAIELRRGSTRQRLANGVAQGGKEVRPPPIENLSVRAGDLISVLIGARDGNHSCDLTAIDLALSTSGENAREWNLAKDVSPDVLAGNPRADRFGNQAVWHFYTEPDGGQVDSQPSFPAGSLLAKWQAARDTQGKSQIAEELQKLLTGLSPAPTNTPDAKLYDQLTSLGGPLLANVKVQSTGSVSSVPTGWAIDPSAFGKRPDGSKGDSKNLYTRAPGVLEIRLPADFIAGAEFVTTGLLDPLLGAEGSVQLQVLTNKPALVSGLLPAGKTEAETVGPWYSNNRNVQHNAPLLVRDGSESQKRIEAQLQEFRDLFPAALCYMKIVPVDEVITLVLFHREDDHLTRLMLDDTERARLGRLWTELRYISRDALTLVDVFDQLWQYATQDADPKVFEPLREPIRQRAAAFRESLTNTQPAHLDAVLQFAEKAYRHPLSKSEKESLRSLYQSLRQEQLDHEDAIRLTLARLFVAPAFLYHAEKPGPGTAPVSVNDWELANRLSYFLWSSAPDDELRHVAASGTLHERSVLIAQARRMLRDARMRRMATEFACAWLHLYGFDELGEKSERHFPAFTELRGPMYEETIRFFTDFFQNDRPVTDILDADYTYLNEPLAKFYNIPGVTGPEWQRVDGVKQYSRGGILGQATTLAKQSGASRTSPILRGNWVSEVLLGEKLPRPPKDVPRLPEDEATETLTVRQLTEKHSTDPRCAGCHRRIDGFGFALEKFDAIGRRRDHDLGNRPIEVNGKSLEGAEFSDIEGLRRYLLVNRHDAFLKQFCRKLLGYSLGRAVQLSDGPLLTAMRTKLKRDDYHISSAIESIVLSKQFCQIRGKDASDD
jgi:hypothetical protein